MKRCVFNGDEIFDEELYENNLLSETIDEELFEELDEELDEELYEELDEDLIDEAQWDLAGGKTSSGAGTGDDFPQGATLGEALEVDILPERSGWAGLPDSELRLAEEELLALEQDSKFREEQEAKRKAVRELNAVNETLAKQNKKLIKTLDKIICIYD